MTRRMHDKKQFGGPWMRSASTGFAGPVRFRERRLKAFLRKLIIRSMANFVHSLRRKARVAAACADSDSDLGHALAIQMTCRSLMLDPATQCERADTHDSTRLALRECGRSSELLCEALQSGPTMHEAAQRLQVSNRSARRLRNHIGEKLRHVRNRS